MRTTLSKALGVSCLIASSAAAPVDKKTTTTCNVSSGYDVNGVIAKGAQVAQYSYEFGYHSEALLEYFNPELAVFYDYSFPDGDLPPTTGTEQGLAYAKSHITTGQATLANGNNDTGNPAALGVAAVLLGQSNAAYQTAAQKQVNTLLYNSTRLSNGAISTTTNGAEAWAEWIMNAPPFLAYYAASTNNGTLLNYTVSQIGLYRDLLRNTGNGGGWNHIDSLGTDSQTLPVSFANGLVAYGIARVLATVKNWGPSAAYTDTKNNLISWAKEIADGALSSPRVGGLSTQAHQNKLDDQGLIRVNWAGNQGFGETSGTALLAAAIYRLMVLAPDTFDTTDYYNWAQVSRGAINGHVYTDGTYGTLSPAVNPYNDLDTVPYSSGSPVGQSGGIFLAAAWRDCVCAGICASPS